MKNSYRNLIVWQRSMELVIEVYHLTSKFPNEEKFGLTNQMRRAGVSIPSNIAEGKMRNTRKDFFRFLVTSYSSGAELETQIEISKKLNFVSMNAYDKVDSLLDEVMRMLNVMLKQLNN